MSPYRQLSRRSPGADRSVVIGIALALALTCFPILFGSSGTQFFDWQSFVMVVGGTLGATLANYSLNDFGHAWRALRSVVTDVPPSTAARIETLVALAQRVRGQGALLLEQEAYRTRDDFLRKGLELAADGQSPEDIRRILETEMRTRAEHQQRAVQVFETLGSFAPALGLIGTLVGLVQMLSKLSDPSTVGPAMSLALITTLYGAILANLIFLPIAGKLRLKNEADLLLRALSIEGCISIAKQENPIMVSQRLQSFLPKLKAA